MPDKRTDPLPLLASPPTTSNSLDAKTKTGEAHTGLRRFCFFKNLTAIHLAGWAGFPDFIASTRLIGAGLMQWGQ
jgi:hypothetical protein